MSTRWYPLYQRGNPQLRVFLPNFWLKLVTPEHKQPKNIVQFHCSMEMTIHDIKNYLEKIYNVNPVHIRTRIALGKIKKGLTQGYVVKDDDIKIAYVVLNKNETFEFPDLFSKEEEKKELTLDETREEYNKYVEPCKEPGAPAWFRI